jgi:phosphoglycolate phosphatase-like HAD superfamily hydrolase
MVSATRRSSCGLAIAALLLAADAARAQTDPLPSWTAGPSRQAILKFVADVTKEGASDFIAPAERIAVFDNDGTLWSEQPIYFQFAFAVDRVKAVAGQHPEWKEKEPFKSLLSGDVKSALGQGQKAILEILAVSHAGMTTDEFARTVTDWATTAKHPRSGRLYTEMVFQPMIELLAYLRAQGFKTFIVSGGGVEFMRPWAEKAYGIPPEQVVGSSGETLFVMRPEGPVLMKEAKVEFVDDGPGKPSGINRFIGRRPVFAFGNSDGDHQMLQWTTARKGRSFCGIVHHTDAEREWAYDRESHIGKLDKAWDEALAKGWTVVDMKKEWNRVYPYDK